MHKVFFVLSISFLLSCGSREENPAESAPEPANQRILASFYPIAFFAERLGGSVIDVRCPVPDDADPIFWMPDREAIAVFQEAGLILLNGAGFEKWPEKVTLPEQRVIRTAAGFEDDFIYYENAVVHQHGPEGEHTHEGLDGHTWLDPLNAVKQTAAIRDAVVEAFPQHRASINDNHSALEADLNQLHDAFSRLAIDSGNPPLLCSHPAYNYVARRYEWDIHNLDLDPEEMPSDETFASIKEILQTHPAKVLLWESEPLPEIVARFQSELGITSVTFSPCELLSVEEKAAGSDYLSVMRENLERLREAISR